MCGIYGIVGAPRDGDERFLEEMDRRLIHRGPDDSGTRSSALGRFGMRRLAIIDLDRGHQPISNETQDVWVTLNGEVYNYRQLRAELEAAGHRFATESDTEVLAHGYEAWGDDLVHHLRGMFAFAIFDERRGRVLLARDRIGKKPLYFRARGGRLTYASELKSLLADPDMARKLDRRAFWHFLTFKHVPAPMCIFEGISQLPAGSTAVFENGELRVRSYWRPSFRGESQLSEADAAARLLDLLRDAVRVRVAASDVPVGAYLSGGIDSSLIVGIMAEQAAAPLHTFSMGYTDKVSHKNDLHFAREMSARFGTVHHELEVNPGEIVEELPDVVRSFDEPFGGTISSYWLSRTIGRVVKVALSGDGADELFGSYANHRMAAIVGGLRASSSNDDAGFGSFARNKALATACAAEPDWRWRTRFAGFTDSEKRTLLSDDFTSFDDSADLLAPLYAAASQTDAVNAALEVDCRSLLPDQVLTYVDRLAMAHSLEVRVPFLDQHVIEFAGTLPGALKVRPDATKSVLKTAARAYLPASIIDRPKEGFVLPTDAYLGAQFKPLLADVFSTSWMDHGLFKLSEVRRLLREHEAGAANHTYKIWTLTMFQLWHKLYVSDGTYACREELHTEVA